VRAVEPLIISLLLGDPKKSHSFSYPYLHKGVVVQTLLHLLLHLLGIHSGQFTFKFLQLPGRYRKLLSVLTGLAGLLIPDQTVRKMHYYRVTENETTDHSVTQNVTTNVQNAHG